MSFLFILGACNIETAQLSSPMTDKWFLNWESLKIFAIYDHYHNQIKRYYTGYVLSTMFNHEKITDFVKKFCQHTLKLSLMIRINLGGPYIAVCYMCAKIQGYGLKRESNDCYVCSVIFTDHNSKHKKVISYSILLAPSE